MTLQWQKVEETGETGLRMLADNATLQDGVFTIHHKDGTSAQFALEPELLQLAIHERAAGRFIGFALRGEEYGLCLADRLREDTMVIVFSVAEYNQYRRAALHIWRAMADGPSS